VPATWLGVDDVRRFDQDDVVELEPLGEARREQGQPIVNRDPVGQRGYRGVGGDDRHRVVTGSALSPLAALHRHFRDGLERRDPVTGLNDHPQVLAFHRMVFETPALATRVASYAADDEAALAEALSGPDARVAASQIVAVQRVLARDNWARLVAGESADRRLPGAVADADRAYGLLRSGLGALYG
jgi:hypothetical protein